MSCDSETFYLLSHGRDAVKAKNAELRRDLGIFVDKGDVSAAIAYMNALEVDWWRCMSILVRDPSRQSRHSPLDALPQENPF